MYFANPWGLLALLSIPIIGIIHLYHRRFPRMEIAGLYLWGMESQVRTAGRRLDRLPITATLLLELLAALLLSLVLSQPKWHSGDSARHLIVVLDNSASMAASIDDSSTVRDAAIAEVLRRIDALPRRSVVSIVLSGRRPILLSGPAADLETARSALSGWNPSAPGHEFQTAWDLAVQLAADAGELLFLTDRLPDQNLTTPERMEIVSLGRASENIAITAARWTVDSATNLGHVYLRLRHFGRGTVEARLAGRAGNETLFDQKVLLNADEEIPFELQVPGGLGEMAISITAANDSLAVDSRVTLIEPKVRLVTVANTLPAEHRARPAVEKALAGIADLQPGSIDEAELLIGSASELPASHRGLWWLGIGPLDSSEAALEQARNLIGPFLIEKRNPLLEGIVLDGVAWVGAQPVPLASTPLISAGQTPLLARLNGTETEAYLLNIVLDRSNLPESPDWPILIKNLADQCRDGLPGLRRWNYRLDEDIQFSLGEAGDLNDSESELALVHQGKSRPLARTNPVEVPPLEEAGVYEVRDGADLLGRFAVNFYDPEESSLVDLAPGVRAPKIAKEPLEYDIDNPYSWLFLLGMLLILVVLFLDWRVLQPSKGAAG